MRLRRKLGPGTVAALLAGGCAAHPVTPADPPTDRSTAAPAKTADPDDRPRWEARRDAAGPATPQQLADRTAAYARQVQTPDPIPADRAAPAPRPTPAAPASGVRFDSPKQDAPAPTVAPPLPSAQTTAQMTAGPTAKPRDPRVDLLQSAVHNSPLADVPREVPESADFEVRPAADPLPPTTAAPDPLGQRLARAARTRPADAAAQLDEQLYALLNGVNVPPPTGLPPDDRDVIAALVDGVSNFRSGLIVNPNQTPTQQIRPLAAMVDRLRSGSDLAITTAVLCRRVDGFGKYDPIAPPRLPAGHATPVIVYYQVDNVQPRQTNDGQWETRLTQRVSLTTAAGAVAAWADERPLAIRDVCRERRRDFFAYKRVTFPPTLAAGPYQLRVTVTDPAANKVAEADVPVTIGGT